MQINQLQNMFETFRYKSKFSLHCWIVNICVFHKMDQPFIINLCHSTSKQKQKQTNLDFYGPTVLDKCSQSATKCNISWLIASIIFSRSIFGDSTEVHFDDEKLIRFIKQKRDHSIVNCKCCHVMWCQWWWKVNVNCNEMQTVALFTVWPKLH